MPSPVTWGIEWYLSRTKGPQFWNHWIKRRNIWHATSGIRKAWTILGWHLFYCPTSSSSGTIYLLNVGTVPLSFNLKCGSFSLQSGVRNSLEHETFQTNHFPLLQNMHFKSLLLHFESPLVVTKLHNTWGHFKLFKMVTSSYSGNIIGILNCLWLSILPAKVWWIISISLWSMLACFICEKRIFVYSIYKGKLSSNTGHHWFRDQVFKQSR